MLDTTLQQLNNPIILALLLLALFCYGVLLELLCTKTHTQQWQTNVENWQSPIKTLIGALPLLGLLGTIDGLLNTFDFISVNFGISQEEIMTGGISDALLTTQLGLVLALPALLLQQLLSHVYKQSIFVAEAQ